MRLSPVFSKHILLDVVMLVSIAGIFAFAGCGGPQSRAGDGRGEGDVVVVSGTVSARGSTPFSLLAIESDSGGMYVVEPSQLAEELRSLDGMQVMVRGMIVTIAGETHDGLNVISYELLRLPSGETPIVGVIRPGGIIDDENMISWIMDGDFVDYLKTFVGAKIWIVGVPMEWIDRPEGRYRRINITEYGVIRP